MYSKKCDKVYHVKKGDSVKIITGEWKNETGTVKAVLKKKDRLVLEMKSVSQEKLAERLGKRTVKKSTAAPKGGLVERAVSVHVSNVKKIEAASETAKAKAE